MLYYGIKLVMFLIETAPVPAGKNPDGGHGWPTKIISNGYLPQRAVLSVAL